MRRCTTGRTPSRPPQGRQVGFPRFKARQRDRGRVRFTTGAMRLEADRRHLSAAGDRPLRSKENTRRLERLVVKGRARVLSMTLWSSAAAGCSWRSPPIVVQTPAPQPSREARCGIDLGIGHQWAVIAHHDGTIERMRPSRPMAGGPPEQRRRSRGSVPPHVGSRGHTPGENQAGGPGPAGGQPPPRGHPHPDHQPGAPLRHHRRRGPRRGRDGPRAWADERSAAPSTRPASAGSAPMLAYKSPEGGRQAGRGRPLVRPPPRPPRLRRLPGRPQARQRVWQCPSVSGWWTATPTRPVTFVTGPDGRVACQRRPGCPAGWSCRPGADAWATTAGRLTQRRGRARPQKTTAGGGGGR